MELNERELKIIRYAVRKWATEEPEPYNETTRIAEIPQEERDVAYANWSYDEDKDPSVQLLNGLLTKLG